MNTRDWPPFVNGVFAYVFGQALVVLAIRFLLGEWPDDPLLLLRYMTVAYGAVAGAVVTALAFAPVVYWLRAKGRRPWLETIAMVCAAFVGSFLLLAILLGPLLSAYVPVMMVIAAVLPAGGGAASALAYWTLAGRPR